MLKIKTVINMTVSIELFAVQFEEIPEKRKWTKVSDFLAELSTLPPLSEIEASFYRLGYDHDSVQRLVLLDSLGLKPAGMECLCLLEDYFREKRATISTFIFHRDRGAGRNLYYLTGLTKEPSSDFSNNNCWINEQWFIAVRK